jgi:CheY-like chemotaxis protein
MEAAAQELKVEFNERVPVPEFGKSPADTRVCLAALRKVGAVPVMESGQIIRFIAVDPAEVRSLPMYDGRTPVGLGTWSDIVRALDLAERRLAEEEALRDQGVLQERSKLSESLVEMILNEVAAHGARSVEIVFSEERSSYQFTTRDGRCGVGNIRRDVIGDINAFLGRFQGSCYRSSKRGEVLVRSLGAAGNLRLSWGEGEITEYPAIPALPSVNSEHSAPQQIALPSSEPPPQPIQKASDRAKESNESDLKTSHTRLPILVVDDNPMFCRVLERLLERDGFEPHFAPNGAAAWEKLSSASVFQPRAIICDLHMPVMNGQELLDRIRGDARLSAVPFVMLTSDDDVHAELSLLARGADAFVSKSKDPRVLCAHIRRLSERFTLQEAA